MIRCALQCFKCPLNDTNDVLMSANAILPASSLRLKTRNFRRIFTIPRGRGLIITLPVSVKTNRRCKNVMPRDIFTICVFLVFNLIPSSPQICLMSDKHFCKYSLLLCNKIPCVTLDTQHFFDVMVESVRVPQGARLRYLRPQPKPDVAEVVDKLFYKPRKAGVGVFTVDYVF